MSIDTKEDNRGHAQPCSYLYIRSPGGAYPIKSETMDTVYIENKEFDKINSSTDGLAKGEYENCSFNNCDFSEADFSEMKFVDCKFSNCNLSMARLAKTAFRDAMFTDCKMLGMHFQDCNQIGLSFSTSNCNLTHSSFFQVKLNKMIFKRTQFYETDFVESDLSSCIFDDCDFVGAIFENTILEKADLRTSYNFSIDPEINRIKKAKFSLPGIIGLLDKYDLEIE